MAEGLGGRTAAGREGRVYSPQPRAHARCAAHMSKLTLAVAALALAVAALGCGLTVQPKPELAGPPPPDPAQLAMERKQASAKYQEELVMTEVGRTHPVLGATFNRDLKGLKAALDKSPAKVNEVRRDLRLGPPLREACRLRWKDGISELLGHGAKCLGDAQCESCVRAQGGTTSGSTTGTGTTTGSGSMTGPSGDRPRQRVPAQVRPVP